MDLSDSAGKARELLVFAQIVQIVPELPPMTGGVGGYASCLARELREAQGISSEFLLVSTSSAKLPHTGDGFKVRHVGQHRASELCSLLADVRKKGSTVVLVHYVGYAYGRWGCPFWLIRALRRCRGEDINLPVVTMFHELFAMGPPWTTTFWTSWFQRHLTAELARLSRACVTNRAHSARWLQRVAPRRQGRVAIFPVFSNFGEVQQPEPLDRRAAQLVVYGDLRCAARDRPKTFERLRRACAALGVERVAAFGVPSRLAAELGLPFNQLGRLPADGARVLLSQSRYGFLDYFDGYLGKSGIFAAYCAVGLLPVFASPNASEADGLRANQHYWVTEETSTSIPLARQQEIAQRAFAWYASHNVQRTATAFANLIKDGRS
ncbi:MAG: glycosyltransferase family 1 protein [Verrucomicrobiota bacterium]